MLLLPIAAFLGFLFFAAQPTPAARVEAELGAAHVEGSKADPAPAGAEPAPPTLEDAPETAPHAGSKALQPAATATIAELERTREQALRAAEQLEAARRSVKVVLFTSERCTRCTEARSHLIARGIHPTERDIDKDPRARARHRALSRKGGLPTIAVDGKVLVGFQAERLDKAIDTAAKLRVRRKR